MELLTISETARKLRVSKSFAYLLAARGVIPTVRIGRVIRVPADRLETWVAERVEASSQSNMSRG